MQIVFMAMRGKIGRLLGAREQACDPWRPVPIVNFIRLAYCRESRDELPHAGRAQAYLVGAHWAVAISSVA